MTQQLKNDILQTMTQIGTAAEIEQMKKDLVKINDIQDLNNILKHVRVQQQHRVASVEFAVRAGVADTADNWTKIITRLGLRWNIGQLREAVADEQFKNSLQWTATPFAGKVAADEKQEQEQQQFIQGQKTAAQRYRSEFSAVVRTATANGRSVADSDANFELVASKLEDLQIAGLVQGTFLQQVTQVIVKNLIEGLSAATDEQDIIQESRARVIEQYRQYFDGSPDANQVKIFILDLSKPLSEVRERLELAKQLSSQLSGTESDTDLSAIRAQRFRVLVNSVTETETMRQQVEQAQQRKDLRNLSREELKELAKKESEALAARRLGPAILYRTEQQLPAEITAQAIKDADAPTQRAWQSKYGVAAVNARLEGRA